jgi:division protein CdvB (Snf7/Vps24/ESCRT-III family)
MGDAIDDALEGDEEEEETEELVNQVLDEIGIDINQEVITIIILQCSHVVILIIVSFALIRYYRNIIFCT